MLVKLYCSKVQAQVNSLFGQLEFYMKVKVYSSREFVVPVSMPNIRLHR